jgi:hypothetical protein
VEAATAQKGMVEAPRKRMAGQTEKRQEEMNEWLYSNGTKFGTQIFLSTVNAFVSLSEQGTGAKRKRMRRN